MSIDSQLESDSPWAIIMGKSEKNSASVCLMTIDLDSFS